MDPLSLILFATLFTFGGIGLGIITGLIPGVHVNTISFLIVSSQAMFVYMTSEVLLSYGASLSEMLLVLSMLVLGCLITHSFLDFIPTTYLGAPEGDTALSVLPAHRLLLEGRGYEAIKTSALGSLGAAFVGLALLLPARLLMGSPVNLYEHIVPFIPLVLFLVVSLLVFQEGRSLIDFKPKLVAAGIFLLAGLLGFVVLAPSALYNEAWVPLRQEGVSISSLMLFPLFTGLFGISNLLVSLMDNPDVPEQETEDVEVELDERHQVRGTISGSLSGGLVGWLPGITAAAATAVTRVFTSDEDDEEVQDREFIMAVSAVDTSCAIFTLIALFVILKARSGAMLAILKINQGMIQAWANPWDIPGLLLLLLYSVVLSSSIAYLLTLYIGKKFSTIHQKIEYNKISKGIISFLIVLIFLFSGPLGMVIALTATAIGIIPPLYGIKRVHMMGCIIFPIILFLTGLDSYLLHFLGF